MLRPVYHEWLAVIAQGAGHGYNDVGTFQSIEIDSDLWYDVYTIAIQIQREVLYYAQDSGHFGQD